MILDQVVIRIETAGESRDIDLAAAYYDTVSMYQAAEGETGADKNRDYFLRMISWANDEYGITLGMSQVVALDRHIHVRWEEFQKKMPSLPTSATSSDVSQANSPSEMSLPSGISLQEFAQRMNSVNGLSEEPSAPKDSASSSKPLQEAGTPGS